MPRKKKSAGSAAAASSKSPAKASPKVNKAEFIRSHAGKSAKEVVDLGKARGISLTTAHIYVVRSKSKKKSGGDTGASAPAKRGPKPAAVVAAPKGKVAAALKGKGISSIERDFINLASKVGLARAESLLSIASEIMSSLR